MSEARRMAYEVALNQRDEARAERDALQSKVEQLTVRYDEGQVERWAANDRLRSLRAAVARLDKAVGDYFDSLTEDGMESVRRANDVDQARAQLGVPADGSWLEEEKK